VARGLADTRAETVAQAALTTQAPEPAQWRQSA
jgi:hypothetical protein